MSRRLLLNRNNSIDPYEGIYVVNIKEDNTLLSFRDTANCMSKDYGKIDWGDSNISSFRDRGTDEVSHTYKKAGVYTVKGDFFYRPLDTTNSTDDATVTSVIKILQLPRNDFYPYLSFPNPLKFTNFINMEYLDLDGFFGIPRKRNLNIQQILLDKCVKLTDIKGFNNLIIRGAFRDGMFGDCPLTNCDKYDFLKNITYEYSASTISFLRTFIGVLKEYVEIIPNDHMFIIDETECGMSFEQTFSYSSSKVVKLANLNVSHLYFRYSFYQNNVLEEFYFNDTKFKTISNLHMMFPQTVKIVNMDGCTDFDCGGETVDLGNDFVGNLPNLTIESVESIISALKDRTGLESHNLKLHIEVLNKLPSNLMDLAKAKNWTIS